MGFKGFRKLFSNKLSNESDLKNDQELSPLFLQIIEGFQQLSPESCSTLHVAAAYDLEFETLTVTSFALDSENEQKDLLENQQLEHEIDEAIIGLVKASGFGCSGFDLVVPLLRGDAELDFKY